MNIHKLEELESDLFDIWMAGFKDLYEEMLCEYHQTASALKLVGDTEVWVKVITLQERQDAIERRLPNVTKEEFDEYVFQGDLIAVLLQD